ncbi:hypothetical protein KKE26_10260 [bacterium]|nr:hypothetical protein [bacterium]
MTKRRPQGGSTSGRSQLQAQMHISVAAGLAPADTQEATTRVAATRN